MARVSLLLLTLAFASSSTLAFTPVVQLSNVAASTTSETRLNNMFADAFKNDDNLGKAKNAGLSGGPNYNEQVTINGKACKNVVVGQAVKVVANSARVKIPYNCQQGDCGTCMIKMNGRKVKACQMSIPSGKCTIQTL